MEKNQADNSVQKQDTIPFKAFQNEEEYNNEKKSISSLAKNEVLKELGVKKLDEIKEMQNKYAEILKTQKSAEELQQEEMSKLKSTNQLLSEQLQNTKIDTNLSDVLSEYNISDEYKKTAKNTVFKLLDKNGLVENDTFNLEELKKRVETVINEHLPMYKKEIKGGKEIPPFKVGKSHEAYLKEKYKNNPYYKG